MMAKQAQSNIFVKEWILQVRFSKSCMGHNRLDSRQKDKKTQFEGNNTPRSSPRMKCSYIHSSLSKYKMFSLCFVCFSSEYIPHFSRGPFLYIVLFLFNLNLSPVDCISNLLDACLIRVFLEPFCVVVRLNITIQASFPHKCNQLVRCRAFNMIVTAIFSGISWFTVYFFIWNLSLVVWYPLVRYSLGDWVPIPHNVSQGSLNPRETTFVRHYLSLSSSHCPHTYLIVWPSSDYLTSSSMTHSLILLLNSFIPTKCIFKSNVGIFEN